MSLADCNINTLTVAAKCFNCLSLTEKLALKNYFLAQVVKQSGGADWTNINVRNSAVACFACEPDFVLDSMEVAVWQSLADRAGFAVLPIGDLRRQISCVPCGEQKSQRAAYLALLCQFVTRASIHFGG